MKSLRRKPRVLSIADLHRVILDGIPASAAIGRAGLGYNEVFQVASAYADGLAAKHPDLSPRRRHQLHAGARAVFTAGLVLGLTWKTWKPSEQPDVDSSQLDGFDGVGLDA